jgi:hypothetical protein
MKNHDNNHSMKNIVDWKVNMLWSEKIALVRETIENKYFDTEMYGWCDIGYFRNRSYHDLQTHELINWPNTDKIEKLDKKKIHYALVNNDFIFLKELKELVLNKNDFDLPKEPIPFGQWSIAGGFFMLHKTKIEEWFNTYYSRLEKYIEHDYLVKDDQMIIVDCVFSDQSNFKLHMEPDNIHYDHWFLFQRELL